MENTVFLAVILAALLHSVWNALVKGDSDKKLALIAVVIGHVPLALFGLTQVPSPDPASWPYLGVGIALHVGYQLFLLRAYQLGDLTQVYPIARGVAPPLVVLLSLVFLGTRFSAYEIAGILTIGLGILSLMLGRQADGSRNLKAAGLAFVTGCFIASYSIVDGIGARLAGTSLGFYGWLAIGNAAILVGFAIIFSPGLLARIPREGKRMFFIGGSASFAAFTIVLWAMTQAPIAMVTALRETSIIFALAIGVIFLKESLTPIKVLSTVITLVGVLFLRLAG